MMKLRFREIGLVVTGTQTELDRLWKARFLHLLCKAAIKGNKRQEPAIWLVQSVQRFKPLGLRKARARP